MIASMTKVSCLWPPFHLKFLSMLNGLLLVVSFVCLFYFFLFAYFESKSLKISARIRVQIQTWSEIRQIFKSTFAWISFLLYVLPLYPIIGICRRCQEFPTHTMQHDEDPVQWHLPKSGYSSVCFLQHQDMSRIECAEKHNNTYVCSRLCVNSWCIKENYRETLGRYGGSVSLVSSTYFSQLPITKSCCLLVLIHQWVLFMDTLWDVISQNVLGPECLAL